MYPPSVPGSPMHFSAGRSRPMVISLDKDEARKLFPLTERVAREFKFQRLDIAHLSYEEIFICIEKFSYPGYFLGDLQNRHCPSSQSTYVCINGTTVMA